MEASFCKVYRAWKIVDYEDGKIKTLFHGFKGNRILPLFEELESEEKLVSDGTSKTKYISGWHIFLKLSDCLKYLPKFKSQKSVVECFAKGIRKKEHSKGEVYLAKTITIKKLLHHNQWKSTIRFFNSRVGKEVTRKEFLKKVDHSSNSGESRHYPLTIDNYRALLEAAGFIDHIGLGKYFVKREIPDISYSLVRRYVEKKDCLAWFEFWAKVKKEDGENL